jgi:hypothetical protein
VFHARPERAGPTLPGWNRAGWTRPPATTAADHDTNRDSDPAPDRHEQHEPEAGPEIPAPRTTPYLANDDEDQDDDGEDPYGEDPH